MKGLKINTGEILKKAGGHAGGLFAVKQLNRIEFIAKQKPGLKGGIMMAIGYVLPEFLFKGKKKDPVVTAAMDMIGASGTATLVNSFSNGVLPNISGYEDYPISGTALESEYEGNGSEETEVDYE